MEERATTDLPRRRRRRSSSSSRSSSTCDQSANVDGDAFFGGRARQQRLPIGGDVPKALVPHHREPSDPFPAGQDGDGIEGNERYEHEEDCGSGSGSGDDFWREDSWEEDQHWEGEEGSESDGEPPWIRSELDRQLDEWLDRPLRELELQLQQEIERDLVRAWRRDIGEAEEDEFDDAANGFGWGTADDFCDRDDGNDDGRRGLWCPGQRRARTPPSPFSSSAPTTHETVQAAIQRAIDGYHRQRMSAVPLQEHP